MSPDDLAKLRELLKDFLRTWNVEVKSNIAAKAWLTSLARFSLQEVEAAMTAYLTSENCTFAPKPGQLLSLLEGGSNDLAILAWSQVMEAASRVGRARDVVFDDPIIHAVVHDLGGWPRICGLDDTNRHYEQKRFADAYIAYRRTGGPARYPAVLAGTCSPINALAGRRSQRPMLLGDPNRARRTLENGANAVSTLQITGLSQLMALKGEQQ